MIDFVIDLPDFWESRAWDEGNDLAALGALRTITPEATLSQLPLLSAAAEVPVADEAGDIVTVLMSFLGVFILEPEQAATFGVTPIRRRRAMTVGDSAVQLDEFAFIGPASKDGRQPLMVFSSPNLALVDTLGDAFARIAATARWREAA